MILMDTEANRLGDPMKQEKLFSTFDEFRRWLTSKSRMLLTVTDNVSTGITDTATKKTANFHSKVAAAKYLADTYGLSHAQVGVVLNNRATAIFSKKAFVEPQVDPNVGMDMPAMPVQPEMPQGAQANGMPMAAQPGMPVFDPSGIQYAADIADPDIVDTGILSAFAKDPDIKELLLDYLPNFIDTLDKIGRCVILLCLRKDELEDFYGRDKYAQLPGSCRKLLKLLGDTVEHLQRYTSMK